MKVPLRVVGPAVGGVLLLSAVVAAQVDVGGLYADTEVLVGRAFGWIVVSNLFWLVVFPGLSALDRILPLRSTSVVRVLPLHVGAGFVLAGVHAMAAVALALVLGPFPGLGITGYWSGVGAYLAVGLHVELLTYWGLLAAVVAYRMHREAQERTRRAAELEIQLASARLDALQSRIQPHFFFNSMNTVAMLVRGGTSAEAVDTLTDLSDLMRAALRAPEADCTTLEEELDLVRRYLRVEERRFADRMRWSIDCPPELNHVPVPPLLLQPLVENAIRHGVGRSVEPSEVHVSAVREGTPGELVLTVSDEGPRPIACEPGAGVGIANTRARVEAFYGSGSLELLRESDCTLARVRIPWAALGQG